jgi:formylglycine-generating enzyme
MAASANGMVRIPAGEFLMGSDRFYPEERPVHRVAVDSFLLDRHPVTNAEFAAFVEATGHVTRAERAPQAADFPGADPDQLVAGSLVFRRSRGPVDLRNAANWWSYTPGACWRRPEGPGSNLRDRDRHPVVHVAVEDAEAYATWAGKELPTEAEWEYAARGGLEGKVFAWGDEHEPGGRPRANVWQGEFPWQNLKRDGYEGTSPVGAFEPNGFGLDDMTGNVWEWTADYFGGRHADNPCCVPRNPRVAERQRGDRGHFPSRVIKGGSHLCAPNYCLRYRPSARQAEDTDTSTGHIGFRCIVRG